MMAVTAAEPTVIFLVLFRLGFNPVSKRTEELRLLQPVDDRSDEQQNKRHGQDIA